MEVQELANENVVTVTEDVSLVEAVDTMHSNHVGDLVVVEADNSGRTPIGIITDRDLVMALADHGTEVFSKRTVGDEMSEVLILARDREPVDEVLRNMRDNGIRRIPVVDVDDHLTGIVTFDDFISYFADSMMTMAELVHTQLTREITGGDERRVDTGGGEITQTGG